MAHISSPKPRPNAKKVRPVINLRAVSRCTERLIKQHRNPNVQSLQDFDFESVISQGEYSEVNKVTDDKGDEYALKRMVVDFGRADLPHNCIQEARILCHLDHPNLVKLQGFVADNYDIARNFILMEYCQENLSQLLEDVSPLEQPEIKCLMIMLLNGTAYLHSNHILHRDIASKNLLIYPSGMLKIGDFGKAIDFTSGEKSCDIGTPGYRAPEIILGYQFYTKTIDMWSIGCILGELLRHRRVFRPELSDILQFDAIIELCGSPTYAIIPNFISHRFVVSRMIRRQEQDNFHNWFGFAHSSAVNLLEKLLTYDVERIKAETVLEHEYFSTSPVSCPPEQLKFILDKKRRSMTHAVGMSPISSTFSRLNMSPGLDGPELSNISSGDFSSLEEGEIE